MARRRKKGGHAEEEHANAERWLLTYADMITLLMVLFIVLFAIGQIDQKKFDKLHDGLAKSFGESTILNGGQGLLDSSATTAQAPDTSQAGTQVIATAREAVLAAQQAFDAAQQKAASKKALEQTIRAALAKQGLDKAISFEDLDQKGLVVNIVTDRVLFDTGLAALRPQGTKVLDALGPVLSTLPNELVVEGHTDSQPIYSGKFASNWELSTARATTVLRYLLTKGVDPEKISAAGYADTRPLRTGTSAAALARNRRVAILILDAATGSSAAAASSTVDGASTATPSGG